MKFIKKFFGGDDIAPPSQLAESDEGDATTLEQTKSRNAPHRDLVQITLRETMRRHGIPSDWIDCRTLSVLTKQHTSGMHVQFLVRKADHQILPWIHELQESFWEQILRTDSRARDWLFSVGWEFSGKSGQGLSRLPGEGAWKQDGNTQTLPGADAGDTLPPDEADDDVSMDLQKLQALMTHPPEDAVDTQPSPPGKN